MAVTVQTRGTKHTFESGDKIGITDGHLFVFSKASQSGTVAIYAPGQWLSVETEEHAEPKTSDSDEDGAHRW